MNFVRYELLDNNDDGDVDRFDGDSVNGFDVTSSWPGDTVTIDIGGGVQITYTGTTFYLTDGTQVFTPTDGQALQNGTLVGASGVTIQGPLDVGTDLGPTCFVAGTLIDTPDGPRPIEQIKVGDLVMTMDDGPQPVLWHQINHMSALDGNAPIRIMAGSLDNSVDIYVSPQHRVLLQGWRAELFFGEDEVFVPAKHLVNGDTILVEPRRTVSYHHLLLETHQVLLTSGLKSESLFPSMELETFRDGFQDEVDQLLEDLGVHEDELPRTIRPVMRGPYVQALLAAA